MQPKTARPSVRPPSPLCTIGPFFPFQFVDDCNDLTQFAGRAARGEHIWLAGRVLEEGGAPTGNSVLEIWQADANGVFPHPLDPRYAQVDPAFLGWGRARTDREGRFRFRTVLPGRSRETNGVLRCPHANLMVLAIGLTRRLVTTIFFPQTPEDLRDPVLNCIRDVQAQKRLFAVREPAGLEGLPIYRFDILLRGENETPFFLD
jgi:protocatechuate 3,4-dioxygenase alpha subunit